MNSYKKLIEELREHCLCITDGCNCGNCEGLLADKAYCRLQIELHKQAADAIEQLIEERDALFEGLKYTSLSGRACAFCKHKGKYEKCNDCEPYVSKNKWEWRGVQNE